MNYITEFLWKIVNMWKSNKSFVATFFVFAGLEIHYLVSLKSDECSQWFEKIEISKIFLYSIIPIFMLCYILFMRGYIPKARRKKNGVMICITNAEEKNYNTIVEKFVNPFKSEINNSSIDYDVIVVDDYHSNIICEKIANLMKKEDRESVANFLKKRRCRVLLKINCINGGNREELLCQLSTEFTVTHPLLPDSICKILKKEMYNAINPVKTVHIKASDETPSFQKYTESLNYIFKFIFATVQLYCHEFHKSLSVLDELLREFEEISDETILPIKESVMRKIGICNTALANIEYVNYCDDLDKQHLKRAKSYMDNKYCRQFYYQSNIILKGICFFVIDGNLSAALQCMREATTNDPVVRFNKIFLELFDNPTINNYVRAYQVYKSLHKLESNTFIRVENFIYNTYKENKEKHQLLFLLFLIYDYQGNHPLAKKNLYEFCNKEDINNLNKSKKFKNIFIPLNNKYKDIPLSLDVEI